MDPVEKEQDSSWLDARVAREQIAAQEIGYAHLSPELYVLQASQNFRELLNAETQNLVGRAITEIIWEFVGAESGLREVLRGGLPAYQLSRVSRQQKNGAARFFDFKVLPVQREQPGKGLLLVVTDTTQAGLLEKDLVQDRNELRLTQARLARANDDLQRISRLKSLFLSMAAHDLRAPLTAIQGYSEILRSTLPPNAPAESHQFLSIIASQIERLNRLIGDLLDLDQIEQGKFKIVPTVCDLRTLITETITLMRDSAERHQLQIKTVLPGQPVLIFADPERIQRVVYNLLSNAIKYTPAGGKIRLSVNSNNAFGEFKIADTGEGMTQEEVSRLFQIYYRTKKVQEKKIQGTGLGLYIVKTFVEAHRGQVSVESQAGEGTVFTIQLPLAQDRSNADEREEEG